MWKKLDPLGTLVDVFIPGWRDKHGFRFGFVRYNRVENVENLISRLRRVTMGENKLYVNLSKFERKQKEKSKEEEKQPSPMMNNVDSRVQENISFKEKVMNGNQGVKDGKNKQEDPANTSGSRVRLSSVENLERVQCLKKKMIGKVVHVRALTTIANIFRAEGFGNHVVDYNGGRWVLLTLEEEEKEKMQNNEIIMPWFSEIKAWSMEFKVEERITWLTISGVPLAVWVEESFKKIASKWGEVVSMESCNFGEVDCSTVKVCILTKEQQLIFGNEIIEVDGEFVSIRITEQGDQMRIQEEEDDLEEGEIQEDEENGETESVTGETSSEFLSDEEDSEESKNLASIEEEEANSPNGKTAESNSDALNDSCINDTFENRREGNENQNEWGVKRKKEMTWFRKTMNRHKGRRVI